MVDVIHVFVYLDGTNEVHTDIFQKVMNDALSLRLIPKGSEGFPGLTYCDLYNISACKFTQDNKQVRTIVVCKHCINTSHGCDTR